MHSKFLSGIIMMFCQSGLIYIFLNVILINAALKLSLSWGRLQSKKAVWSADISTLKVACGAKLESLCEIRLVKGRIICLLPVLFLTQSEFWRSGLVCVWEHRFTRLGQKKEACIAFHHEMCAACDATTMYRHSAFIQGIGLSYCKTSRSDSTWSGFSSKTANIAWSHMHSLRC